MGCPPFLPFPLASPSSSSAVTRPSDDSSRTVTRGTSCLKTRVASRGTSRQTEAQDARLNPNFKPATGKCLM